MPAPAIEGLLFQESQFAAKRTGFAKKVRGNGRGKRSTAISGKKMSKWSALKTSVATQNQQLRAKLLEQSSTLWERIRLKILDNPKRIEISGIKTANIALGVVTLKNSQAIRHLMLKVFKKQVECRQEWEKEIVRILCDEIDTLKAMKQFIPKNAYDHLCQHLTIQTFLEGDVLFKPGDVPRCSYIVLQGCVEERLERTLANQLLSEMKIHNHNDRKMSGSKVDAFNVLDSDANDFGWKEEGFDDYVNGLLGITVRSHCMNNSFGSRSRGENLHLRTSTAIAKKGAGKARLVDVLVMKFNAVDQVIPLQRQSAIDQYRISMKAEEKYNTLITFLRRECSLLKKIHPISLLEYIQCCDVREFTKGTFLCNEDKTAECVYILLSGSVRFQYQNQTNDCDDQGISPMMPNAPPKPPIFCLQQNKCLKDVIVSDVKPGSMFGESFVLDKIEGRRTQMTLEKRMHELAASGSGFTLSAKMDLRKLSKEPISARAMTDCKCLCLKPISPVAFNKPRQSFTHEIHKDILSLMACLSINRRYFWKHRRQKAKIEQSNVVHHYYSDLHEQTREIGRENKLGLATRSLNSTMTRREILYRYQRCRRSHVQKIYNVNASPVSAQRNVQTCRYQGPSVPPHQLAISQRPMSAAAKTLGRRSFQRRPSSAVSLKEQSNLAARRPKSAYVCPSHPRRFKDI
jgi:CRP-like cAMP-binding protein